jgi:nitroreductase
MIDTFEAIFTRYSCDAVKTDPVPREMLEQLLAAAVQAPNHYRVRPWRFVVLQGQARERLGDLFGELFLEQHPEAPQSAIDKERAKPLRAPVVIAVGIEPSTDPRAIEIENMCAAAAAVENLLLAAHALGLGAKWRTGTPVTEPRVKSLLGLHPDQELIAFVYIGYPAADPPALNRASFEDRTTWLD